MIKMSELWQCQSIDQLLLLQLNMFAHSTANNEHFTSMIASKSLLHKN